MLPYTLIGIDPSYSRTGLCAVLQDGSKRVVFHTLSHPMTGKASVDGEVKRGFHAVFESAFALANDVAAWVRSFGSVGVIMEEPLPASSMSPALYALDSMIFERLHDSVIHTYNPSTLRTIHTNHDASFGGIAVDLQRAIVQFDGRHLAHRDLESLRRAHKQLVQVQVFHLLLIQT